MGTRRKARSISGYNYEECRCLNGPNRSHPEDSVYEVVSEGQRQDPIQSPFWFPRINKDSNTEQYGRPLEMLIPPPVLLVSEHAMKSIGDRRNPRHRDAEQK